MTTTLKKWIIAAAIILMSVVSAVEVSQAAFPEDTWNVTISGHVVGVGYLTFLDDDIWGKIVHGLIVLKPTPFLKGANIPSDFHMGSFEVDGSWAVDGTGKVMGFFSGGSEEVQLDVSFTATGTATKLTMAGTGTNGKMNIKGIPSSSLKVPTTDLSGEWIAQVTKNGVRVMELFTLEPLGDLCIWREIPDPDDLDPDPPNPTILECVLTVPAPNTYFLFGVHPFSGGPGYDIGGILVLSSANKIGLALEELHIDKDTGEPDEAGEGVVRSAVGTFKAKTLTALLRGNDNDSANALVPSVFMTMTPIP